MTDRYAETDTWLNPPTSTEPALPATHAADEGSQVLGEGSEARESLYEAAVFDPSDRRGILAAVVAVRDAELEQARAENERLRDLAQRNFKQGAALLGALTEAREQLSRLREAVERALDDEEANLADDGARLSHSVVRRLRAVLADVPPAVQGDTGDAPPAGQEAGEAQWWDADHNRPADAYTPPERTYCKRCGAGRLLHGEACVIKPSRGIRHPAPSGSDDTKGGGGRG